MSENQGTLAVMTIVDDRRIAPTDSVLDASDSGETALPTLIYSILTPGLDDGYTPFQGFGVDISKPAYSYFIRLLAVLPASIPEIFSENESLPKLRQLWPHKQATIVGLPSFNITAIGQNDNAISIILALPDDIKVAQEANTAPNPIYVTTEAISGAITVTAYKGHPAQLLDSVIRDRLLALLDPELREKVGDLPLRPPFPAGNEPTRLSGVTEPNETLCESLGYSFSGPVRIDPEIQNSYVDAITHSVDLARSIMEKKPTDAVVYCPSIVRHLYAFGNGFWNKQLRRIRSAEIRKLIKDGIFRNPNYSGFSFSTTSDPDSLNPYSDETASAILQVRQIELSLTAAAIGALATSRVQPAIRLPNAINFHNATLREIERHARRDDPRGQELLHKSYSKLALDMHKQIHSRIIEDIREHVDAITLVADPPLEWLRIDGLPLMIRHEISRIGMTPGNLMLAQCIESGTIEVPLEALLDVLVIRSLQINDPIRPVLEAALDGFNLQRVRTQIIDVTSRDELIVALNNYQGFIAVFDCHGGHGGDDGHGWLQIGTDRLDVWELAHVARIPPIVLLSACSTFALAGSHASVANGLIRSGATTVIGTFLPVDAIRSAIIVARLLLRVDQYLPILKGSHFPAITWRNIVSTFFKMSYATDLLRFFIYDKKWMNESMLTRIGPLANRDINSFHLKWYSRLLRRIARASGKSTTDVQSSIDADSPLMETMYYCQIGRPESISIIID